MSIITTEMAVAEGRGGGRGLWGLLTAHLECIDCISDFRIAIFQLCSTQDARLQTEREGGRESERGSVTERELVNNWLWVFRSRTVGVACHGAVKSNTIFEMPLDFSHRPSVSSRFGFDFSVFMHAFPVWRLPATDTDTFCVAFCVLVCVCIFDLIIVVNSFSNRINLEATRTQQISWCEKYLLLEQTRVGGGGLQAP